MKTLPLFPVTTVGSWPRPPAVLEALRQLRRGRIERDACDRVIDDAIRELVRLQEQAGCDLITDGELRRDNFYSFVHVCRGNWSRDETTLLRGSYRPLAPYLERLHAAQLVLETGTRRG